MPAVSGVAFRVMPDSDLRPLERALEAWATGAFEDGLRWAVPVLAAQPDNAAALLTTVYLTHKAGGDAGGQASFVSAAARAVDVGNLPLATAGAALAKELGFDPDPIYELVASAFARSSPRLKHRAPPAFPAPGPDVKPLAASVEGAALLEQAKKQSESALEGLARGDGPLPAAPLFSSLEREPLEAFLRIFEVTTFARGKAVLEEGSLGSEAYVVARGELDVTKKAAGTGSAIQLARLGGGALVGEMALLSRAPRAATVSASRPALLLVANKRGLDAAVRASPDLGREFAEHCRRRMLDNLVKTSTMLRSVNPAERSDLVQRFAIRAFEAGEALVSQGKPSEGLFLLASGQVSIVHQEGGGEGTVVAQLGPGEVLGEVALVLRRPAIADAVAHHPTITLFLPRERFLETMRAHPKVLVDLYELAVRRDEETASAALSQASELDDSVLV
jgi:CRP-like cAMP-binding protein